MSPSGGSSADVGSEVSELEVEDTAHWKDECLLAEPETFRRDKTDGSRWECTEWRRWRGLSLFPDHPSRVSFSQQIRSADADLRRLHVLKLKENMEAFPWNREVGSSVVSASMGTRQPSRGRQETSSVSLPNLQLGRVKESSFICSLNRDQEAPGRPLISHWIQMSFYPLLLLLLLIF